jgi:hypothetical protein
LAGKASGGIATVGKNDSTAIVAGNLPLMDVVRDEGAVCHVVCAATTEDAALRVVRRGVPGGRFLNYSSRSRRNRMWRLRWLELGATRYNVGEVFHNFEEVGYKVF